MNASRGHLSFLLRLWQADSNHAENWRVSLENLSTGERKGFATIDSLMEFLEKLTDENQPPKEKHENDALPKT